MGHGDQAGDGVDRSETLTLRTLRGPVNYSFTLKGEGAHTIGRLATCEVCLLHENVSRNHAVIEMRAGEWYLIDQGGPAGTYLGDVKLEARKPTLLAHRDVIRIGPWTFAALLRAQALETLLTIDDADAPSRIEPAPTAASSLAGRRLMLLTECITGLQAADDEATVAQISLRAAVMGTGYSRGAFIRPVDNGGLVEVVASYRERPVPRGASEPGFSRSLLRAASEGRTVVLSADAHVDTTRSIIDLGLRDALCTPVMIGTSLAGLVYLDTTMHESRVEAPMQAESSAFAEAVSRALGLALADRQRRDLQRRQGKIEIEMASARVIQDRILPPPTGEVGHLTYASRMRAGLFLAADLFDMMALPGDRVAVCMGDVAGHGPSSALLMASLQSHLSALLSSTGDPALAVAGVNRFLVDRLGGGQFATLWVGVISRDGVLTYVDAGHGYALAAAERQPMRRLASADGIPVGIQHHEFREEVCTIGPGGRLVLFSDGVVEQSNAARQQFGVDRLLACLPADGPPQCAVDAGFEAVTRFAGRSDLDDDATIAVIDIGRET